MMTGQDQPISNATAATAIGRAKISSTYDFSTNPPPCPPLTTSNHSTGLGLYFFFIEAVRGIQVYFEP